MKLQFRKRDSPTCTLLPSAMKGGGVKLGKFSRKRTVIDFDETISGPHISRNQDKKLNDDCGSGVDG